SCENAQAGDKARHQNGLVSVTLKILFHTLYALWSQKNKSTKPQEHSPAIVMTDGKANVVADDCAARRDQHHEPKVKFSGRREIPGDQQNRLTGNGDAGIFEHHAKEYSPVSVNEHIVLDQL